MMNKKNIAYLPTSADEMKELGWNQADIILFSGDAYVDHPAFGVAVIARVLEAKGYKVAVVPQPNWRDDLRDFKKLGVPRLFFGVSSGNMDSMVNHYTARKRLRSDDAYSAGGRAGFRPDYATKVYSQILKKLYPDTPLVIGGIEASLRRFTHYDYWSDSLMPSILEETSADVLVYGMGEKSICEIADRLHGGKKTDELRNIPQTVIRTDAIEPDCIILPSFIECTESKKKFALHFTLLEKNSNNIKGNAIAEKTKSGYLLAYPPHGTENINDYYDLPYTRLPHPRYRKKPPIPAYEMIRHSINIHRGCFGACSFCTISMHQGRFIKSRSQQSIFNELEQVKQMPDYKGTISDLGGPSANMYGMNVKDEDLCIKCKRPSCLYPKLCNNINANHTELTDLYKKAEMVQGVSHVFVTSGLRYDLFINEDGFINDGRKYFEQLVKKHISGRLKVAPEHSVDKVLKNMRKPSYKLFRKLKKEYNNLNRSFVKRQEIIPYIITGHPGENIEDCINMARSLKEDGLYPEQIQDFTPTPMTLSSAEYYLGFNPYTGDHVQINRDMDEKKLHNSILLYHKKEFRDYVIKNLRNKHLKETLRDLLSK
ncbi:MAG: YgiQ family radical SAM protein [Marinilabiliales bacterium]|nr:MAG: YgiQ family radical SAM protein [Marinilabiliales bacterium]